MRSLQALALTLIVAVALPSVAQAKRPAPEAAPTVEAPVPVTPRPDALESAYQKEFAYLDAELRALQERLASEETSGAQRVHAARRQVDELQGTLVRLRAEAEVKESLLSDVERATESLTQADDMLASTVFQAANSLTREGFAMDAEAETLQARSAELGRAFAESATRMAEGRTVRIESGPFLDNGRVVQGDIIRVGTVASFGIVEGRSAALVPDGGGHMRMWRDGGGATGLALLGGQSVSTAGLFLYERPDQAITQTEPKTLGSVVEGGGLVGLVILGLGALAFVLIVVRVVLLARVRGGSDSLVDRVAELAGKGRVPEAMALLGRANASVPRVLRALLEHSRSHAEVLEDVAAEALLREVPRAERFGSAIMVAAAVAPLLGLLGTVTGMISTFDIITEFGTGDPRKLSGGISEALITTQLGLIVAIPALLLGNLLNAWAHSIMGRTERAALALLNALVAEREDESKPQLVKDRASA